MISVNIYERIGKVFPFIIYVGLILFLTPTSLSFPIHLSFYLYALFIFWIAWPAMSTPPEHDQGQDTKNYHKFFFYLFIFSILFLVTSRLLPFIRYGEAPLGYDTGFYHDYIRSSKYTDFIPPGQSLAGERPSTVTLHWNPLYSILGIPWSLLLHGEYILIQLLLAGSLYTLARTIYRSSNFSYGSILLFLFSTSLVQFFAFWWMFFQQELSLAFLIMTLALLYRRSYLAIIIGGVGAAIHFPTFLPLGLAFMLYIPIQIVNILIQHKKLDQDTRFLASTGILMLSAAASLRNPLWVVNYIRTNGWLQQHYPSFQIAEMAGLFINSQLFYLATIYIIPFALIGILLVLFKTKHSEITNVFSRHLFLILLLLSVLVLTAYPFVYQHRFFIHLDAMFIIFAVYPLFLFLKSFLMNRMGHVIIALLIGGLVMNSALIVWSQEPQLYPDELAEIKALRTVPEKDAYAMSIDAIYSPWVSTFSERPTITPGLLAWDQWNLQMWNEFWNGKSDARRHELLHMYSAPLYIFVGRKINPSMPFQNFIKTDYHFTQISPHVWKYDPKSISTEEINRMKQNELTSN